MTIRLTNQRPSYSLMAGAAQGPSSTARGMYYLFLGNVTATVLAAVAAISLTPCDVH